MQGELMHLFFNEILCVQLKVCISSSNTHWLPNSEKDMHVLFGPQTPLLQYAEERQWIPSHLLNGSLKIGKTESISF
ncbi:hypothetical protein FGO68_gene11579 [Halteria grandinella]|uniref:Uncharacterized protein n=1 Tax=Halteria grandinella TaxID=5974 RepID=A0A8J8P1E4_HALGN|nr:hypothetical protein FGO68_gene11579 [Halteria grandinella]